MTNINNLYIQETELINKVEIQKSLIIEKEKELSRLESEVESISEDIESLEKELDDLEVELIEVQDEISDDRLDEITKEWKPKVKENFDSEMDQDR